MEFNISNEKLEKLVEQEIARYVRERIERVMNDGKAYWFSQQNIENVTRDVVMRKITSDFMNKIFRALKTDEFLSRLSDCIAGQMRDYLCE